MSARGFGYFANFIHMHTFVPIKTNFCVSNDHDPACLTKGGSGRINNHTAPNWIAADKDPSMMYSNSHSFVADSFRFFFKKPYHTPPKKLVSHK